LSGGFATFENVARHLSRGGKAVERRTAGSTTDSSAGPAPSEQPDGSPAGPSPETIFRATGRLVEVYATVKDSRGHYVDDLAGSEFTITLPASDGGE